MLEEYSVTNDDIKKAVVSNNCEAVTQILEGFGMYENTVVDITSSGHVVATLVLNFASASAARDNLSQELAQDIISYTASSVDIFTFLSTLLIYFDLEEDPSASKNLPAELIYDICRNNLNSSSIDRILALDEEEFFSLVQLIVGDEVSELNYGFSIPIMHYLYHEEVLPLETLLGYMATNLAQPSSVFLEELSRGFFGILP